MHGRRVAKARRDRVEDVRVALDRAPPRRDQPGKRLEENLGAANLSLDAETTGRARTWRAGTSWLIRRIAAPEWGGR
jgi:hypothetical protein